MEDIKDFVFHFANKLAHFTLKGSRHSRSSLCWMDKPLNE